MSKGWFEGLIVWPIAQIINLISSKTDAGVGIILTTLLIQMLVFVFTRKSQMSTQRMQEISPEIQKIQINIKIKQMSVLNCKWLKKCKIFIKNMIFIHLAQC